MPYNFQSAVGVWLTETFAEDVHKSTTERAMRFLEEALELCQALNLPAEKSAKVMEYVYGRPVGEPSQEVGGVMVTLAAICHSTGMDMEGSASTELARIDTPEMRAKIAAKQVSKRLFGMTHDTIGLHCEHCGRLSNATSTHCAPPFKVQPHAFTGNHPADKAQT